MALFRKFFFRKPPDGVLLITDNIYGKWRWSCFLCVAVLVVEEISFSLVDLLLTAPSK